MFTVLVREDLSPLVVGTFREASVEREKGGREREKIKLILANNSAIQV